MTNFEYYAEQIQAVNYDFAYVDGKITKCPFAACTMQKCKFTNVSCENGDCEANKIKWLYSEHVEQPKLTKNERMLCEMLKPNVYVAREKSGAIYAYTKKPLKKEDYGKWVLPIEYYISIAVFAFKDCNFSFIKWEDEEPWCVEDLLKLEVE